ncbi:DMT family transporter [Phenylobacterium sp.]|uniref:DMT family transporter n=1 Tax=Phenylobacterium sp. TaxID=1871053 RepID=UPI00121BD1D8|nr:DMT family transporter [Phenylobacterium sp.]THD71079.1 MAG: DMT family transporter [Phenylobacterium sp.]
MLWILLTAAATPLQVARNALQRGLVGDAGPWGATLVRFLFGLPFSLAIFGAVALATPGASPHFSASYAAAVGLGAISQIGATAALLVAMRRAGFAVATVMQQSSLPLSAVFGWLALGDRIGTQAWIGIAVTSVGLVVLSWPRRDQLAGAGLGSALGLASGGAFAVALNAYRQAGLALEPHHPIYSATASVCVAQAVQTAVMVTALALLRPASLLAVGRAWRASLGAGFFGAAASACWFAALALAPAGPVRAVGVIEAPIAAAAGRRLFKERLSPRQLAGGVLAAIGVAVAALG